MCLYAYLPARPHPGTLFRETRRTSRLSSIRKLVDRWNSMADSEVPEGLKMALRRTNAVAKLIKSYGDVLADLRGFGSGGEDSFQDRQPIGTVLSLPGSVVHAGPAMGRGKTRAVIFFSATPVGEAQVCVLRT